MRASVANRISMSDLVQHCGVAERTLNEHFRCCFAVSPLRYFRQLRLAAARDALLADEPSCSVTEIAQQFGFNHCGRFAQQYRQRFGEAPSATLRRGRATAPLLTRSAHQPPAFRDSPSIAVLPFRVSANKPELREIAESLAEMTASVLLSGSSLNVATPRSLRHERRDLRALARELNAQYLLTGRVLEVGTRLRAILQLVTAATGRLVWGDSFEGSRTQPLSLQDKILATVPHSISANIREAEIERARLARPENLGAYGLTMRALPFVFAAQPDATQRACELLYRAIELAPDYGLPTALTAWCHGQLVLHTGTATPDDDRRRAMELSNRAAVLDDGDPIVLACRCAVHTMLGDFAVAETLLARALARDPWFGWAWGKSGWLNSYKGNSEAAIAHFGRALSLEREGASRAINLVGIATAHFHAERYDVAAIYLQRALLERPDMWFANRSLSVCQARLGDQLKALKTLDTLRRNSPDLTVGRVVGSVPFRQDFLDRLANGLSDLGLPP